MKANRKGVTLIELMVAIAMVSIVVLSVGIVLVDTQRGWNKMYERVHGAVATDSIVAKKVFDNVVRKSSKRRHMLEERSLTVYYYNSLSSAELDRYTTFRRHGDRLIADFGPVDTDGSVLAPSSSLVIARNVVGVEFSMSGASARMVLRLDDEQYSAIVSASAVRHNE
jgi:prepilin-type N-terminal cleavage/methylation domain-containing protein